MMKPLVIVASVVLLAACGNNSASTATSSASSGASETPPATAPAPAAGGAPTAAPAAAETGNWKMIPELSRITFTGTQTGDMFMGEFKRFTTVIQLDPNDLTNAHIEATIDISSVDAHDEQRNQALPGNEWFGVTQFPTAVFRSDSIKKLDDGKYEATGKLTIRDVSKDVVLPFTLDIDGDKARAFGELNLTRTDYNVGTGEWADGKWVGLPVMVTFDITATRVGS
jgi:polyisoprenoid-binding protein YceI